MGIASLCMNLWHALLFGTVLVVVFVNIIYIFISVVPFPLLVSLRQNRYVDYSSAGSASSSCFTCTDFGKHEYSLTPIRRKDEISWGSHVRCVSVRSRSSGRRY